MCVCYALPRGVDDWQPYLHTCRWRGLERSRQHFVSAPSRWLGRLLDTGTNTRRCCFPLRLRGLVEKTSPRTRGGKTGGKPEQPGRRIPKNAPRGRTASATSLLHPRTGTSGHPAAASDHSTARHPRTRSSLHPWTRPRPSPSSHPSWHPSRHCTRHSSRPPSSRHTPPRHPSWGHSSWGHPSWRHRGAWAAHRSHGIPHAHTVGSAGSSRIARTEASAREHHPCFRTHFVPGSANNQAMALLFNLSWHSLCVKLLKLIVFREATLCTAKMPQS